MRLKCQLCHLLWLLFSCSVVANSFVTPCTVACQALLSMGFPRQEYWLGLPFPSPGESFRPKDRTCVSCIAGGFFTNEPPGKPRYRYLFKILISFPLDIVPELKLLDYKVVSLVAQRLKHLPAMWETTV